MNFPVQPAGNAKTALAELQGLKRVVMTGMKKVAITGITLSTTDPVSILAVAHGLLTGDTVYFGGTIVGTTELNGTFHTIAKTDADNFTLDHTDSSDYTAWTSGGTTHETQDVTGLKPNDAIFSVLAFDGDGSAAVSVLDLTSEVVVVAKKQGIGAITLTGATTVKLTVSSHGLATGDYITINDDIGGTVELAGKSYIVNKIDSSTLELPNTVSSNFTAYTSGGEIIEASRAKIALETDTAAYRLLIDFFNKPAI